MRMLSQLLWAAYGVTARVSGHLLKTAPSAGALYPLDIYAVVGDGTVEDLAAGLYRYRPEAHSVVRVREGDLRSAVAEGSLRQMWMARAPVMLVITGEYGRSTGKYGSRGVRYTHIEAGHVGQSIFLQAEAIGLQCGIVGAFADENIRETMGFSGARQPLLIMPVGFPN
jgi:SagB-type dehydrogenase family enzyme